MAEKWIGRRNKVTPVMGATIGRIRTDVGACESVVIFKVQRAGTYAFNIWDDANFLAGEEIAVPAGGSVVATITVGEVLTEIAGVGLYVEDAVGLERTVTYARDETFDPEAPECEEDGEWTVTLRLKASN